ncbi:alpha/beta-hydrolase [Peniophora sp. CONT]|nr:alpha/beta-hydrolase [Peniophora sp. CONT]
MAMNPLDPSSYPRRSELLSTGRTYHFVDTGSLASPSAPTLLCIHGFPDNWYGYRHQIPHWSRVARVIVPDMLGYGGTDKPRDASEYSTKKLCADMTALLDVLGVQRAVVIGHDWGAFVSWRFALWAPERLKALIIFSIPYTPPRTSYVSVETLAKIEPAYAYQAYFANPTSTKEIEAQLPLFLDAMYGRWKAGVSPTQGDNMRNLVLGKLEGKKVERPFVSDSEIQYTRSQIVDMNGPLSYYRTIKYRFDEEADAKLHTRSRLPDDLPVLFAYGTADPTATPSRIPATRQFIPKLTEVKLEGIGHWVMLQAKDEVTAKVLGWLEEQGVIAKAKL